MAETGRQCLAYGFVFDACAAGRRLNCLKVIDEFTREYLAIDVAGGIRPGVIEVLTQLVSVHDVPRRFAASSLLCKRSPSAILSTRSRSAASRHRRDISAH
jgi:hypothetical protein